MEDNHLIYACEKCKFLFERVGAVEKCPDCGRPCIREANDDEQQTYQTDKLKSAQEET